MLKVRPRPGQLTVPVAPPMLPIGVPAAMEVPGETDDQEGPLTTNLIDVVVGLETVADGCAVCLKPLGIEDRSAQLDSKKPERLKIKIAAPPDRDTSRLAA